MESEKKHHILLIEDDSFVHELYKRALTKIGFQVSSAFDGEEGVQLAQQKKVDLILLDILLPKLNGVDVLRKLKSDPEISNIPVILLTNLGQESIIREAFRIGADGFLLKARLLPIEVAKQVQEFFRTGKIASHDIQNLDLDWKRPSRPPVFPSEPERPQKGSSQLVFFNAPLWNCYRETEILMRGMG